LRFIDIFSGIGGFRLGMEQAGHKCVGYIEIDKYARKAYQAIHNTEGEWTGHDITKVIPTELPRAECYTAGFPCQSFSVAGRRGGFEDTRGTLFFEIMRLAKERKPKILLLENVKGLLSHNGGKTFGTIITALSELGYDAEWEVLNSKDFGVPQNRERVFIIGHSREQRTREVFPIRGSNGKTLKQLIGGQQGMRVYDPQGISCTLSSDGGGWGAKTGLYSVRPCLTPERPQKRQNGRRFKNNNEDMFTLTSQDRHGIPIKPKHIPSPNDINNTLRSGGKGSLTAKHNYDHIHDGYRIRKLTPRECWRLQGFPDWAFEKAKESGLSDSQLYKQAGNSVTVNVVYEIAGRLGGGVDNADRATHHRRWHKNNR